MRLGVFCLKETDLPIKSIFTYYTHIANIAETQKQQGDNMKYEDKHKEGMTLKDIKDYILGIERSLKPSEMLIDKVRAVISPCPEGFFFTVSPNNEQGITLKSSRGHFRVFKTIDPIIDLAASLGFERCELWTR